MVDKQGGMVMYSANDIAKYVVKYCESKGISITNLKLQKLLYYIQGFFLAIWGKPIFSDEIQAWEYGPVVPDIYYRYKAFVDNPIHLAGEIPNLAMSEMQQKVLNIVIDNLSAVPAWKLVQQTHEEDPWKNTFDGSHDKIIINDCIQKYFATKLSSTEKGNAN
jgi:uncharacterized phage-associated protein